MMARIPGAFVATFALLLAQPAFAQSSGTLEGPRLDPEETLEIAADRLEVLENDRIAIFRGDVIASQKNFELTAEVLEIVYGEGQEDGDSNRIESLRATGQVVLTDGSNVLQSNRLLYDAVHDTLEAEDEVRLVQNGSTVLAQSLSVDFRTGRYQVAGTGPSRVRTIIEPEGSNGETE